MKTAIIIPTFNRHQTILPLLQNLLDQMKEVQNVEFRIIVVNDGSTDGTPEKIAELNNPLISVIHGDGNLWFTRSVNQGADYAIAQNLADFILILNDDLVPEPLYLLKVAGYLSGDPIAHKSVIAPLTLTYEKPHKIVFSGIESVSTFSKRKKYHPTFTPYVPEKFKGIHPSIVLPGRGMLFPAAIFQALGGLDNRLYQYHSDEDFCLRAHKKGYNVLVNWEWLLFSHHEMTSSITSFKKVSMKKVFRSFFNRYSRNYIPDRALMTWRHQPKILFPLLFAINYTLIVRSYLKK